MPTNRELINAAWAEVLVSTISGVEWQKRVTDGYKGKPYNWQNTAYGRGKALLDQVADCPVVEPPPPPVVVPPPPPPPPPPSGIGSALPARPTPPSLSGRVVSASPSDWSAKWSVLASGDEIRFSPGTYPALNLSGKSNVKVVFDPAALLAGVYIARLNSSELDGGFALSKNPLTVAGDGWKIDDSTGTWFHRLRGEDCGGMGLLVSGHAIPTSKIWVTDVFTRRCGGNPPPTDYASKGVHGAYIGGAYGGVSDSVFGNFDCDNPNGHGIQIGGSIWNSIFTGCRVKATRSDRADQAGSGFRVWADSANTKNIVIVNSYGEDCFHKAISSSTVITSPMATAHHVASVNSHGFEEYFGTAKGVEVIEATTWFDLAHDADPSLMLPWDIDGKVRVRLSLGPRD